MSARPQIPSEGDTQPGEQVLLRSDRIRVVRRSLPGGGSVIIKEPLGHRALQRLRAERQILERLALVAGVSQLAGGPQASDALAIKDPCGVSLREVLQTRALALPEALDIALQLARILAEVHRLGVTHRDINPSKISMAQGLPRLIGFDLATTMAEQQLACDHHGQIAGALAYLAPEQTGRTGRPVDQRADLYGLGATLYELVTGRAPFEDSDPLQLIHKVLAQRPAPPALLVPETPAGLSDIMMRLLEKESERRYQSAEGLAHDLARLRDRLAAGESGAFTLGEHDFAARLSAPSKPVGRDTEIAALTAAFAAVVQGQDCAGGVLLDGASGVGKTMLINELRPLATARGGWFVIGSFDPYRHDLAGDGVYQALRALGRLLLAEPEAELVLLRQKMLLALGPNAGLMVNLPEFVLLLGIDPPAQTRPSTDEDPVKTERRLLQACLDLLRSIASPQRPLVIALDDLQWAAALPLAFIDAVLTEAHLPGVLLVGACRGAELDAAHPLTALSARWERLGVAPLSVKLGNLPPAELGQLVGAMLRLPPAQAAQLAGPLAERTAGNPLDTIELVNALRHDGALLHSDGGWLWDAATIRRHIGSGNVIDLLTARIERLPHDTREALATLACLGGEVGLDLLAAASDVSAETLEACVAPALEDGLLVLDSVGEGSLRFRLHRVQQAAWERIDSAARQALQLSLARRLAPHHDFIEVAAGQYLGVIEAVQDTAERRQVAQVFHHAALQARHTNGVLAERLLASATGLLAALPGPPEAALMAALAVDRHAVLYALGRHEEADAVYASMALDRADPVRSSASTCIQVSSLHCSGRWRDALALGLEWLAALGIAPPRADAGTAADMERRMDGLIRWVAESSDAQELLRAPMQDPQMIAAARLIGRMMPVAFGLDQKLRSWLTLESVRLWVEHGPCAPLVSNLGGIPATTIAMRADHRTGYRAARRILTCGEALGCDLETAQARTTFAIFASPWFDPLEETAAQARRAIDGLVRGGDAQYAVYAQLALVTVVLDCEPALDTVRGVVDRAITFTERTGNEHVGRRFPPYREFTQLLCGEAPAEGGRSVEAQAALLATLASNPMALAHFHLMQALTATLFGHEDALSRRAAAAMAPILCLGTYSSSSAHLLLALALAGRVKSATAEARGALLAEFDVCADWLRGRAADSPANFSHLALWVEAERAWACGDHFAAACAFDAALHEGAKRQRPWHNALITERAALLHLGHGLAHTGRQLLAEARSLYQAWGAAAKVQQLERNHDFLNSSLAARGESDGAPRDAVSADTIDMLGIVRASQALSSETSLHRLRLRVVELLGEMTGATSVQVLLWSDDAQQWLLPPAADGKTSGEAANLTAAEAAALGLLPLSVFRYADRTRELLLVDDATRDDRFAGDPYLSGVEHCSLLVVPILSQGAPRAMLLLENRLGRGAFTADRLDAVMLVTGQLAVSLANAQLYEQLEQRVRERTRELQEAQSQLLAAARLAGMAEIATNVLHNVGNVLNSVNVSAGIVSERLRKSKLTSLVRAVRLMDEHAGDLGAFLTQDAKGKLLPGYLRSLTPVLEAEHLAMADELGALGKSVDHIKDVVATQQSYAGAARMLESVRLDELVDDALRMNAGALTRHKVDVVKQLAELPALRLDRHRLLQILVNLISNAKEAMDDVNDRHPCITLSAALANAGDGCVLRITVADNGIGIAPENLTRVFAHGFTTRKNGHGFGLHSCVLAAQEMDGSLSVHSEGSGHGATLTLEIPVDRPGSA